MRDADRSERNGVISLRNAVVCPQDGVARWKNSVERVQDADKTKRDNVYPRMGAVYNYPCVGVNGKRVLAGAKVRSGWWDDRVWSKAARFDRDTGSTYTNVA